MNCHLTVKKDSELLAPIRASAASGRPMRWIRVHELPDYAYFAHSVHVAAGVGCVTCHGRIDEMETVTQMTPLSVSWSSTATGTPVQTDVPSPRSRT